MRRLLILTLLGFMLSGCMFVHKMDIEQGNVFTPEMVKQLHPGMTQKQVTDIMGSPMLMNTFNDNRVDYVYTYMPGGKKATESYVTLIFKNGRLKAVEGNMYSVYTRQ